MVASNLATKWIRHSDFAFSLSNFAFDRISFRERQKFEKKQFYAWLISLSFKKKRNTSVHHFAKAILVQPVFLLRFEISETAKTKILTEILTRGQGRPRGLHLC